MPATYSFFGFLRRTIFPLRFVWILTFSLLDVLAMGQNAHKRDFNWLRMNEVNASAARHFVKNYTQATDVKWTRDDFYNMASFKDGDSYAKAYYKTNGNFAFCIKDYGSDMLDPDVKSTILKKFPECQIRTVKEITSPESRAYIINIKDGNYIKNVQYNEDGIDVTETIEDVSG